MPSDYMRPHRLCRGPGPRPPQPPARPPRPPLRQPRLPPRPPSARC